MEVLDFLSTSAHPPRRNGGQPQRDDTKDQRISTGTSSAFVVILPVGRFWRSSSDIAKELPTDAFQHRAVVRRRSSAAFPESKARSVSGASPQDAGGAAISTAQGTLDRSLPGGTNEDRYQSHLAARHHHARPLGPYSAARLRTL
jgi:hypothetical protein